jgi:2-dehydropantoate 2-reductase
MRILVYGAGAVGQAVGGLLALGGCDVTMLLRPAAAEAIGRNGLRITGIFGEHVVPAGRISALTELPQRLTQSREPFDFVLLTVKSYDTAAAIAKLRGIDDGHFVAVSLQNGYGNVEQLLEAFGPDRTLCGRVITGFVIPQPGTVQITVHADAVTVGRFDGTDSPAAARLAAALDSAGLPARASRQVQAELWAKILYNCALNPLGAILGVVYGKLAERAETRELMDRIIDEAYAVMEARNLPRLFATAADFRAAFYGRMVPPTAAHTPSMLQDLRAGKRTEIDALNGAVVRLGEGTSVNTPVNRAVCGMVKFLERKE